MTRTMVGTPVAVRVQVVKASSKYVAWVSSVTRETAEKEMAIVPTTSRFPPPPLAVASSPLVAEDAKPLVVAEMLPRFDDVLLGHGRRRRATTGRFPSLSLTSFAATVASSHVVLPSYIGMTVS